MPSSFIDLERRKGLLPLPSPRPRHSRGSWRGAVFPARDELTVQPRGWGRGWGWGWQVPRAHRPCRGEGGPAAPTPRGEARCRAEQSRGSPNSSGLCKGKITNIFHFQPELNLEVLWLQGASFPTLSWSDLHIPPLSSLIKT